MTAPLLTPNSQKPKKLTTSSYEQEAYHDMRQWT